MKDWAQGYDEGFQKGTLVAYQEACAAWTDYNHFLADTRRHPLRRWFEVRIAVAEKAVEEAKP